MDWLGDRQEDIEKELSGRHLKTGGIAMFDLSSSWEAWPTTTTLHPLLVAVSASKATTVPPTAAASFPPPDVRMITSLPSTVKFTGWIAGSAHSVNTIRPTVTVRSSRRHSARSSVCSSDR
jgi:hypothetical protein